MIQDLKPYPTYKDSGAPWLGNIPKQWKCHSLCALSRIRVERNPGLLGLLSIFLDRGVIPYAEGGGQVHAPSLDLSNYQTVRTGDFVLNNQQAWRGSVGVSRYDGIISPAYVVLELSKQLNPEFANYMLRSPALVSQLLVASRGVGDIQRQLHIPSLRIVRVLAPPLEEQSSIARFLNQVDRRIQSYIRAKKKLIALLNEQKQAIIHRAVTLGLDPDVRLKPSGVEWLGHMPQHWHLFPLKQLLTRMDYGTSENLGREGSIKVLTMSHIKDGEINLPTHGGLNSVPAPLLLEKHDLLFNRTNSPDLVGKVGIFRGTILDNVSFASYLVRLRTKGRHSPHWLNWLLNSTCFWAFARSQALVSLHQANLNSARYGQMLLPVPPPEEQLQISAHISRIVKRFGQGVTATTNEISLLREYRVRLIADVVTGKLDVREAAARLPEDLGEPEVLEDDGALAEDDEDSEGVGLDASAEETGV